MRNAHLETEQCWIRIVGHDQLTFLVTYVLLQSEECRSEEISSARLSVQQLQKLSQAEID